MSAAAPPDRPSWGRSLATLTAIAAAALLAGAGMRLVTWETEPAAESTPARLEDPAPAAPRPPSLGEWEWRRDANHIDDMIRKP